ncbi:MAG: N-acetyltransferase [Sphingobacteriia bacterium]|nr:N-acetyltransferase [Sphingobacteriia bacterium]
MSVREKYRQQGIGTKLLKRMIDTLVQLDYRQVFLEFDKKVIGEQGIKINDLKLFKKYPANVKINLILHEISPKQGANTSFRIHF